MVVTEGIGTEMRPLLEALAAVAVLTLIKQEQLELQDKDLPEEQQQTFLEWVVEVVAALLVMLVLVLMEDLAAQERLLRLQDRQ